MSKKDQTTGTNSRIISFTTLGSKTDQAWRIRSIQFGQATLKAEVKHSGDKRKSTESIRKIKNQ